MRALLVSGHMTDSPSRSAPRFREETASAVGKLIGEIFDRWDIGPTFTVICGGARGTDILAAEHALARNARVILCLAMGADDFAAASVAKPGTDWLERYRHLLLAAEVRQVAGGTPDDPQVFAKANAHMVVEAHEIDPQPYALFVWDGRTGDGPGGTSDLVDRLGYTLPDPHVAVIDPTAL